MKQLYIILIFGLFFTACQPNPIHSEKLEIDNDWLYQDQLKSKITVEDTIQKYDLALKVNHSKDFYFQNIYLNIETLFPDGNKKSEPLSLQLANRSGNWIGKCNKQDCETVFSLQDNFRFKQLGDHEFTIGQFSREEKLVGVNEIELLLFESQKK